MLNSFRKIMKEQYGINDVELTSNFKTDFGLSSFDFVNLICLIEETYKVELDEEDYLNMDTVGDLVKYIEEKQKNRNIPA